LRKLLLLLGLIVVVTGAQMRLASGRVFYR